MKKGLVSTVIVLVVLYAAAAWVMGYSIERRMNALTQRSNDANPYVKVSSRQFHRGWFVSDQEVTLELAGAVLGTRSPRITLHTIIHHGPICGLTCVGLAQSESHLTFSEELQPYVKSLFGSAEPLILRSRLGLFGGGNVQMSSPAIETTTAAGGHWSSGGMTVSGHYDANVDHYALHGALPLLAYAKDGKRFEASNIQVDIDATRALRTLYVGNSAITMGQLRSQNNAAPGGISIGELKISSQSSLSGGFLSVAVKYGVSRVIAPSTALTGADIDVTFRHLDADTLEQFSSAFQGVNLDATIEPRERPARIAAALKQPTVALLAKQPEVAVDRISASTATGSASMSGLVSFQALTADDLDGVSGWKNAGRKIDVDLDTTVDDGFLSSIPGGAASVSRLQSLVSQGLARHDGGTFHTKIGYHGGQVSFDGKPFGSPASSP